MDNIPSYFFYFSIVLVASTLAWISKYKSIILYEKKLFVRFFSLCEPILKIFYNPQKIRKKTEKNYSYLAILFSFFVLTIPVAFRHYTGADFEGYVIFYNNIKKLGAGYYIDLNLEIGYVYLNVLCEKLFDHYQSVFIVVAVFTNYFFYKGMTYESKKINLGVAVFVYGFSLYFWDFIIIRNMLGISIIFYSMRFLFEKKYIRYFLFISIAVLFHYSLIVFFAVGLLYLEKFKKTRIFIPILLLVISPWIPSLVVYICENLVQYYDKAYIYLEGFKEMSIVFGRNMTTAVGWLVVFSIFYKKINNENDHISLYFSQYFISVILLMFAVTTPIITRYIYALLPGQIILIAGVANLFEKKKFLKVGFILIVLLFGMIKMKSFIDEKTYYMAPYKSVFSSENNK